MPLYLSLPGQLLLIAFFPVVLSHVFFFFTCLVYPPLHCLLVLVERYQPSFLPASLMPAFVIGGAEGERACVLVLCACSFLFCDIG